MRETATMNSRVNPAVVMPSRTHDTNAERVKDAGRGRTNSSISTPAHARRSHATPAGPTPSINFTASAAPSCTDIIDATVMSAPFRAAAVVMRVLNGNQNVHVHVIIVDISFAIHE